MQLKLFKTLWGHEGSLTDACIQAISAGFNGVEGPAPDDSVTLNAFKRHMNESGLDYIAEITTAGSYVPDRTASLQEHLDSFEEKLHRSLTLDPLFITCLGGCDAWPEDTNLRFFEEAMNLAKAANVMVSFETHRSRALFNPWITAHIAKQLPELHLTVDYSHWCVVCERLMDSELDTLQRLAPQVHHVHARVGYDQGPQVPNPAAPEYEYALRAHQRWWELVWASQRARGYTITTMTPEFGPDGYLQAAPFTQQPVADLWAVNQWMAEEERRHFSTYQANS